MSGQAENPLKGNGKTPDRQGIQPDQADLIEMSLLNVQWNKVEGQSCAGARDPTGKKSR
jgi:hypothetical protein